MTFNGDLAQCVPAQGEPKILHPQLGVAPHVVPPLGGACSYSTLR